MSETAPQDEPQTEKEPRKRARKWYVNQVRGSAKELYLAGYSCRDIGKTLNLDWHTVTNWRNAENWDRDELLDCKSSSEMVEAIMVKRLRALLERDYKSILELQEMKELIVQFAAFKKQIATAKAIGRLKDCTLNDLTTLLVEDNRPLKDRYDTNTRKKKKIRNDITGVTAEQLQEVRERIFFGYQKLWNEAKETEKHRRTRFILKSRQIGATYYFAWEALEDAILTGENQIFLSASRDQAHVFRSYMVELAKEHLNVDLTGDPIILCNGAELRFLSTNHRTAQSYHGHLYVDEVFWIPYFQKIWKVSSGMAAHKRWRRTLFSTPSAISHEAYPMWSGEVFNKTKLGQRKPVDFDLSHEALKEGVLGPDKIWRHMVTVEDAEAQGCDLFDIDELRMEYADDDFRNLFMCQFIDDAASVFPLSQLLACGVEASDWQDWKPEDKRPLGNKPVAVGYDPQHSAQGDNASMVLMAVPLSPAEKWRVLKRWSFRGQSFEFQAARIKELVDAYNVVHIGIDVSGPGYGVYERVMEFFPAAEPITYSVTVKNQLVVKAKDVLQAPSRLEFDAGDKELIQAFLMIRQSVTPGTGQVTYFAGRNSLTGHADPAWAVMHALKYEPINAGGSQTTVSFSKS